MRGKSESKDRAQTPGKTKHETKRRETETNPQAKIVHNEKHEVLRNVI